MKKIFILLLFVFGSFFHVCTSGKEPWQARYTPIKGEYLIYGGSLSEQQVPGRRDRKVAFRVVGSVAKDMFDAMHPDDKLKCTTEQAYRERNKDGVSCTYAPDSAYVCYFGFDLRTGKSIGGAIC